MEILAITAGTLMLVGAMAAIFSPLGDLFTWRVRWSVAVMALCIGAKLFLHVIAKGEYQWFQDVMSIGFILGTGLIWAARKRTRWIPKVRVKT